MIASVMRCCISNERIHLTHKFSYSLEGFRKQSFKSLSAMTTSTESQKRQLTEDVGANKRLCSNGAASAVERVKKRKVAMLLSYSGQGYFGMQRNPYCKTIEEDLLNAMFKVGFINDEEFNQVQAMQFQRAARTDKGVSAVRQVVSLKLVENADVEQINSLLPQQIKVMALKRVTKGFNSKTNCDARTYSYLLPTYSFSQGPTEEFDENYRAPPEVIQKIKDTLKIFEGTHNFHNFTSKKNFHDPSAFRYILKFDCDEPFVRGLEFIVLKVKGQSFMLHQIRKMVGLTIAIVKDLAPVETITKAWGNDRLDIPVAPGLGLMLEEVHYDRYNKKFGKDGMHENLVWDEVNEPVDKFKSEFIYPTIIDTEVKEKPMYDWLVTLPLHTYDLRDAEARARFEKEESADGSSSLPASDTTDASIDKVEAQTVEPSGIDEITESSNKCQVSSTS